MSLTIGVKIFSDLCLYFAFAGGVFARPMEGMTPAWGILLCAAGAVLGAELDRRRPGARLAGLIGPVLALLTAPALPHYLLLLPALAYTGAVIATGRFHLDHGQCCEAFPRQLLAIVFLLVFSLLGMVERGCALLYGGLHVLSAFFLLRQLRLQETGSWQSRTLNLFALLAAVGGGAGLCLAIWGIFHLPISLDGLWTVVFYVLAIFVRILFWATQWLLALLARLKGEAQQNPPPELVVGEPLFEAEELRQHPLASIIFTVLAALLLTFIAFRVIRHMVGNLRKPTAQADTPVTTQRIAPQPRKKTSLGPGSNREKLRRCYRKFLKLLHSRGLKPDSSLTTEEIHRQAQTLTDPDTAGALRRLYLPARYDEHSEVTSQQVREAKELLKALRKEPEN